MVVFSQYLGGGVASFFAHSTADVSRADWQPLPSHLLAVGDMAAEFAGIFAGADLALVLGRLHDLGKYTQEYLQRISGGGAKVDHSSWGAIVASQRYPQLGPLLAYAIAGHHAGLANGDGIGERTVLRERLQADDLPELDAQWMQEIPLPDRLAMPKLNTHSRDRLPFQLAFLVRMLFSCLVDADFIDTERFYARLENRPDFRSGNEPSVSLQALRGQLDHHLGSFKADKPVNELRAQILAHVCGQASLDPGLFSLTVPTGGGKTLASLAFALDHAIAHGLQRVIFVIPFTSIVEQNAAVFRKALGALGDKAVLEHHSAFVQSDPPKGDPEKYQSAEKLKLAMENWDAPIVVTTAVQFFESLFAAKPSQCRKLHNIAGSVVVLDEAQTMPLNLLRPCVAAIDELARNYRASVVLCTATQPTLDDKEFSGGLHNVRELAPDVSALFKKLERVRVRHVGVLSDEALADEMRQREQVLCIVNNRRHARAVYQSMADMPGARHLTTLMCAQHRRQVLDEVRRMLKAGEPCRLVSTSLIEAGVDVDFPTVLRAEAGLDSIAQAAGRCNREGSRKLNDSEVLIFATDNPDWAPPREIAQYADRAREVLRQYDDQPLSPEAMQAYFGALYWHKGADEMDKSGLLRQLAESRPDSLPMEDMAKKFRLIDNKQMPVIVRFDEVADRALDELQFATGCGRIARKLQPYVVQLPVKAYDALLRSGAVAEVAPGKWNMQFMELVHRGLYDKHFGINTDEPSLIGTDHLCW